MSNSNVVLGLANRIGELEEINRVGQNKHNIRSCMEEIKNINPRIGRRWGDGWIEQFRENDGHTGAFNPHNEQPLGNENIGIVNLPEGGRRKKYRKKRTKRRTRGKKRGRSKRKSRRRKRRKSRRRKRRKSGRR